MYKLLKIRKDDIKGGFVYHLKKNGSLMRKLSLDEGVVTFDEESKVSYVFFIIKCESSDYISYGGKKKKILPTSLKVSFSYYNDYHITRKKYAILKINYTSFLKDSMQWCYMSKYLAKEAQETKQLAYEVQKQGLNMPDNFENLLTSQLRRFFSIIINKACFSTDSASIFEYYAYVLKILDKQTSDFLDYRIINNFILNLCEMHDVPQITKILESGVIEVSSHVLDEVAKTKSEFEDTKAAAKERLDKFLKEQYNFKEAAPPKTILSVDGYTPCGRAEVWIDFFSNFYIQIWIDNFSCDRYMRVLFDVTDEWKDITDYVKNTFEIVGEKIIQD